jgi:two-component system response regulator CpxR
MRPKKVLLLVDSDPRTQSVRAFVLETRGFRVLRAATVAGAIEMLEQAEGRSVDCLVCASDISAGSVDELARRAKELHPELRVVVLGTNLGLIHVDLMLARTSSPADVVERIRILTARKRGPKKARSRELGPAIALPQEAAA